MCQKTKQGGRGKIKRRAQGWCRSQRADPAARDGPDPVAGSGSCQTEKPDRGAAGLSGEAGMGPGVRWRDHCSNKDPLEDGGAGLFSGARVGPGGRWRDHCSNEGFTLPLGSFCLHRKNYFPHPPFCSFSITLHTHQEKNPPPSFPFVARLPPLPEVPRLLSVALHLSFSSKILRLLFVALRLYVGRTKKQRVTERRRGTFSEEGRRTARKRRRRATKGGGDSPIPKGGLPLPAGAGKGEGREGKEGFERCIEGEGCA